MTTTTYWTNLRTACSDAIDALAAWAAAIAGRIEDPMYDDVVKAKARIRLYINDAEAVDNIVASIRNLPPIFGDKSFITYVHAAQSFVICGANHDTALSLLRSCITAEHLLHGKDWEHRIRIISRLVATGRITREDHTGLAQQGIALPEDGIDARVTPEVLAYAIRRALPGWIGG